MKRLLISLVFLSFIFANLFGMSYKRAREEALYLTDKMAYELNLNEQQYDDAYEINLDYLMSIKHERDLYADYLDYRLNDFRYILHEWQFELMLASDYFIRPVLWRSGALYFPIYNHYRRGYFYYDRPRVYGTYRGGHGYRHYEGRYYSNRRPVWNGGLRGGHFIGSGRGNVGGNGFHFESVRGDRRFNSGSRAGSSSAISDREGNIRYTPDSRGGRVSTGRDSRVGGVGNPVGENYSGRGNSFENSSSRSTVNRGTTSRDNYADRRNDVENRSGSGIIRNGRTGTGSMESGQRSTSTPIRRDDAGTISRSRSSSSGVGRGSMSSGGNSGSREGGSYRGAGRR